MKFQDYVDAIILDKTKRCVQTVIRSYQHNVFPEDVDKIAISARDDKRVWLEGVYDMAYQYGSPTLKRLLKEEHCVKNWLMNWMYQTKITIDNVLSSDQSFWWEYLQEFLFFSSILIWKLMKY